MRPRDGRRKKIKTDNLTAYNAEFQLSQYECCLVLLGSSKSILILCANTCRRSLRRPTLSYRATDRPWVQNASAEPRPTVDNLPAVGSSVNRLLGLPCCSSGFLLTEEERFSNQHPARWTYAAECQTDEIRATLGMRCASSFRHQRQLSKK